MACNAPFGARSWHGPNKLGSPGSALPPRIGLALRMLVCGCGRGTEGVSSSCWESGDAFWGTWRLGRPSAVLGHQARHSVWPPARLPSTETAGIGRARIGVRTLCPNNAPRPAPTRLHPGGCPLRRCGICGVSLPIAGTSFASAHNSAIACMACSSGTTSFRLRAIWPPLSDDAGGKHYRSPR